MAQTANQYLDADELLHLALEASRQDKHEEAITFLKRALALNANDARLHYLLGAEHAQIGLYDRAVEEMQQAVKLDPALDTAHFQLGLLHITSGRAEAAAEAWKPLDRLGPEHPLFLFKTGLVHLAKDEFTECEEYLRRGLSANKSNAALNNDMQRVLKEVENRTPPPGAAAAPPGAVPPKPANPKHVLLSAYKRNRLEDKDN
jgi:tetratricopeptide (TPR) repeat protein